MNYQAFTESEAKEFINKHTVSDLYLDNYSYFSIYYINWHCNVYKAMLELYRRC
jgi:hypothetical protein